MFPFITINDDVQLAICSDHGVAMGKTTLVTHLAQAHGWRESSTRHWVNTLQIVDSVKTASVPFHGSAPVEHLPILDAYLCCNFTTTSLHLVKRHISQCHRVERMWGITCYEQVRAQRFFYQGPLFAVNEMRTAREPSTALSDDSFTMIVIKREESPW